jgi:5S rRNA maturation endonuclease (ribonuclease M5)
MSNFASLVQNELDKLHTGFGKTIKSGSMWVRCPWHRDGQERTPSLSININGDGGYPPGSFICFGCGEHGGWSRFAKKVGLRPLSKYDQYVEEMPSIMTKKDMEALLGDEEVAPYDIQGFPWPANQNWRNISGETVHKVGGLAYFDDKAKTAGLFLPVSLFGSPVGGIKCNIIPSETGSNYYNTDGQWRRRSLYPYDYVKENFEDLRIVTLMEGPRDSLNFVQYNYPGLASLGTQGWTEEKTDLVLSLRPKIVVLGFDPDEAGDKVARKVNKELKKYTHIIKLNLPSKNGRKIIDASEMSRKQIKKLYSKLKDLL